MTEAIKKKEADDAANLVDWHSYVIDGESIICLTCGMRSWNAMDIQEKYCGNCHKFHDRSRRNG